MKTLLAIALLAMSSSAWATCTTGKCPKPQGTQHQDQSATAIGKGGNASSSAAIGDTNSGGNVLQADTYSQSVALALPTIQTAAPSFVAGGNMVAERSACGPRVVKVSERVTGVLGKVVIDLGTDDNLEPAAEPYRYWNGHIFGHQVVTYAASNGVAASKAFGFGGNGSSLAGGQLGASSNSAASRTVLRIVVMECEIPRQAVPALPAKEPRG